jgi:hypothetical protein
VNTHDVLEALVKRVKCKPGWSFRLEQDPDDVHPKLVITVPGWNSAHANCADQVFVAAIALDRVCRDASTYPSREITEAVGKLRTALGEHHRFTVQHFRPVPEATFNEKTWRRWIFEQCRAVENHELGEWFRDGGDRPFAPLHGPGEDPYTVHEFRPESDALTTQDGSLREPYE